MDTSHQSSDRVSSGSRSRALSDAAGGQERGTHEPDLRRGRSLYVQAIKQPLATVAAVAGAAVLVGMLAKNGKRC